MKKSQLAVIVAGGLLFFSGMIQAQDQHASVTKTIRITATIGDNIYVSQPASDGWYSTVSLAPTDSTQTHFSNTIPVQVWSTTQGFTVSLVHSLEITRSDSAYKMAGVNIKFAQPGSGGKDLSADGLAQAFTQKVKVGKGYESVYQLQVNASAPAAARGSDVQGLYTGDLVMLFEVPVNAI